MVPAPARAARSAAPEREGFCLRSRTSLSAEARRRPGLPDALVLLRVSGARGSDALPASTGCSWDLHGPPEGQTRRLLCCSHPPPPTAPRRCPQSPCFYENECPRTQSPVLVIFVKGPQRPLSCRRFHGRTLRTPPGSQPQGPGELASLRGAAPCPPPGLAPFVLGEKQWQSAKFLPIIPPFFTRFVDSNNPYSEE